MDDHSLSLDRTNPAPLYRQLEAALATLITTGGLQAGDRLPSERELADHLGVSRTTTVNAYRELEARGLIRGRVGRGTFVGAAGRQGEDAPFVWQGKVAADAQRTLDPTLRGLVRETESETISFAGGAPAMDQFPIGDFRMVLDRIMEHQLGTVLGLGPTEGQPRLRVELGLRYDVPPEQVLVLAGSQQGLDLITRSLVDPGETVVMDRPGYLGAIQAFRAAGARVIGWDARRHDPDELESLFQRYRPKFLYTNPTFHNPTGRTIPLDVRREILVLAARYRVAVVEDEPYRDLPFHGTPPPTLRELDDQGLVVQLGTFSKTLAAGLRLGWLIAPVEMVDQLALMRQRSDLFGASVFQLVMAELLTRGVYDSYLRKVRIEHEKRYDTMATALRRVLPAGTLRWTPVTGGLYLWLHAGTGIDSQALTQQALAAGVAIVSGEHFFPDGAGRHQIRLCFARNAPQQIVAGIERLGHVFRDDGAIRADSGSLRPLM